MSLLSVFSKWVLPRPVPVVYDWNLLNIPAMNPLIENWAIERVDWISLNRNPNININIERIEELFHINIERFEELYLSQQVKPIEVEPFECCICLEEEQTKQSKKCKNKHSDKICHSCVTQIDRCPFCREVL
jgi:hypothetical protein